MTTLSSYFDMVFVYATETSGHGPFTLGAALVGFQSAASAGITNGTPVSYKATDGTNWETAHGVVDVSGSVYTLTRGIDTIKSSNSNALVSFGSGVTVSLCPISQDLNALLSFGAAQTLSAAQKRQALANLGSAISQFTTGATSPSSTQLSSVGLEMAGFDVTYTPSRSGNLLVSYQFNIYNGNATNNTVSQGVYGTGTPPAANAALTGTTCGPRATVGAAVNQLNLLGSISGLTVGTAYWFDLAFAPQAGGTANVGGEGIQIVEF